MNFQYFWYTKDNIPEGLGFNFLGARHIITWLICLAVILTVCFMFKKLDDKSKEFVIRGVGLSIVTIEIIKDIVVISLGQWDIEYLPLHVCGVNVILIAIWLFTRSRIIADLLYCLCSFGAALALTTPNWMTLPVWNFMHLQTVTIHTLLVIFPILVVMAGHRPNIKNAPKCFGAVLAYSAVIYVFNKIFDSDFVFLNGARNTPFEPLVKIIGPLYVIPMMLLLGCIMLGMYLPWHLADKKRAKTAESGQVCSSSVK